MESEMNERIRELAQQAGCKVMDDGEWYIPTAKGLEKVVYTSGIGLEKFAELIVRECVSQIETVRGYTAGNPDPTYAQGFDDGMFVACKTIEEHLGVGE